jgi:hypothetical protein
MMIMKVDKDISFIIIIQPLPKFNGDEHLFEE